MTERPGGAEVEGSGGLRVLAVTPYPPSRDGIGQHASELLEALPPGHEPHVLTTVARSASPHDGAFAASRGVEVHRVELRRARDLLLPFRIARQLEPDLVHVQFAFSLLGIGYLATVAAALLARKRGHLPLVVTDHEVVRELERLGPVGRLLHGQIVRRADLVTVYSEEARSALVETCGGDGAKVVVVPHGMPVRPVSLTTGSTRPGPADDERPVVFTFGFLHPDKGLEVLLDAVRILSADPGCPPFRVILAGEARARKGVFRIFGRTDRAYADALESSIASGLGGVVSRRPYLSDEELDGLLRSCAAFVAPYLRTTQSGATNKAVGAGAVVVASDLPGLRSGLGDAALWVTPGSATALADALRTVLTDVDAVADLRAANVVQRAAQSMRVTAERQAGLWQRLIR